MSVRGLRMALWLLSLTGVADVSTEPGLLIFITFYLM